MIKRISKQDVVSALVLDFCRDLAAHSHSSLPFKGEVDTSYSSRLSQSTDNSVYQAIPQAILFPKTTDDLLAITELANDVKYQPLKFTPKGGGTGTNGQALTDYIVVDMSRHMRNIIEFNESEGWVRVQAGLIKDQLNDYLKPFGYFFAPDLSTSNRATIGGMINTDASGQGSLVYGKTSDHVLGLTAVTIGGQLINTQRVSTEEAKIKAESPSPESALYRQALDTCTNNREKILETFPRLNRFLTGYDLENVFDNKLETFDLGRLLTGSEGTLAFITEAKLNVTPIAKFKTMLNISYDSFDSALRNSPFLVEANATSVETIDSKVLGLAKRDVVWSQVSELIYDEADVEVDGLNIVEFNDEDEDAQNSKVSNLCTKLDELIASKQSGVVGYCLTNDRSEMQKIYAMRKKSVGLLGNVDGKRKPVAFAEDTAVPPEHLADFIAEFRALLDGYNLDYGMFGHVDAGVLHVRPALDLMDPEQEVLLRSISDQVVKLTAKYNGLMWGEHGKGYRSEYGPEFFGEALFNELRKIKAVFDPLNRLNPGKICTPFESNDKLVSVDAPKRASSDKQIPIVNQEVFATTINCNGNGLCFNYDKDSVMCPSYKATNDRRMSPKGRATLMREWLRLQGDDMNTKANEFSSHWLMQTLRLPFKLVSEIKTRSGVYDFSHEVKESMDACLACKACTSACPVKVDVPTFRSEFLQAYYLRYFRKFSDYLVAGVESLMPFMSRNSKLANLVMHNPVSRFLTESLVGYIDAPQITQRPESLLDKRFLYQTNKFNNDDDLDNVVFIAQDAFTSSFESQLIVETVRSLEFMGYRPIVLPFVANGKPQHVKGFLNQFKNTAKEATDFYNKIHQYGRPIVGLDASMTLSYRDEYIKALGSDEVQFEIQLLSEWLVNESMPYADTGKIEIDSSMELAHFDILSHCTEKSLLADSPKHWPKIFSNLGLNATATPSGCCGMAGTFGHEKANQETSKSLFEMSWAPILEKAKQQEKQVLATGFSCRCQSKRFSEATLLHPIQAIAKMINNGTIKKVQG